MDANKPVAVVTGATGGIGRWIALGLARAGHHVILLGRNRDRGESTQAWIAQQVPDASTELILVDLSLLAAAQDAADAISARHPRIKLLVNNAGAFDVRQVITAEGHNRVIATNLLAPFVLTRALLPALRAATPARIVNTGSSSSDHAWINPEHLIRDHRWGMVRSYSQSKLALMMMSFALARRLQGSGVVANVVHPGFVASGLIRAGGIIGLAWRCLAVVALTEQQGAETPLHVALSAEFAAVSGVYVKNRQAVTPNRRALDPDLAERVWTATQRLADSSGDGA